MKKEIIFVPITRGFTIRDILANNLLYLIQKELREVKFVIFTHKVTKELKDLTKGLNVIFEEIPIIDWDNNFKFFFYRKFRNLIWMLIYTNSTIKAKLPTIKKDNFVAYYLLKINEKFRNKYTDYILRKLQNFSYKMELFLTKKDDEFYDFFFKKYSPKMMYLLSPFDVAHIGLQRCAKRNNIPVICQILSWDNLTTKCEPVIKYNRLLVWSEMMKNEAIKYHRYNSKKISVVGAPQFDLYIQKKNKNLSKEAFFKKNKLDLNKKLITYTTTTELLSDSDKDIIQIIIDMIKEKKIKFKTQLLIRVYSRSLNPEVYKQFEKYDFVKVDYTNNTKQIDDKFLPDENYILHLGATMKYSDLVINIASTICLDATAFLTPAISINFDGFKQKNLENSVKRFYKYEHLRKLIAMKGIFVVNNKEELNTLINILLKNPKKNYIERKETLKKFLGPYDGNSNKRIAKIIIDEYKKLK